jgi:hypothetical protein
VRSGCAARAQSLEVEAEVVVVVVVWVGVHCASMTLRLGDNRERGTHRTV